MIVRILYKVISALTAIMLALALGIWLIWIPSATEADYQFVKAWGEQGAAPGQFNDPTGIAVSNTEVFVSDARNGRIQVFDFDGHYQHQFGNRSTQSIQLGRLIFITTVFRNLAPMEPF